MQRPIKTLEDEIVMYKNAIDDANQFLSEYREKYYKTLFENDYYEALAIMHGIQSCELTILESKHGIESCMLRIAIKERKKD